MLLSAALADPVIVTTGNGVSVDVAEGDAVSQVDRISVQDGGSLYKTGKGTLNISIPAVIQSNPLYLGIRQGTVKIASGGVAPDETADDLAALTVMSNAAFWVRADEATGLVVTNGGFVAQWRDVREGAVSDPAAAHAYPYAEPRWDTSLSSKPLYGVPPNMTTAFGQPAVCFGGWGSSQKMWWFKPDGKEFKLSGIRHAFIVQGVKSSYGFAVMARNGQNADFHVGTASGNVGGPIWVSFSGDGRAMRDASRTYLNGTIIDGPTTAPPKGENFLLDVRFMGLDANAGAFFTDRDINGRTGGDYLSEVLVFTNKISDVDCELVSRYLLKRYRLNRQPEVTLQTARDTTVECEVQEGECLDAGVSVTGVGSMTKTGLGTLVMPFQKTAFDGDFKLREGDARVRTPVKFCVNSGENVTITADNTIDMNLSSSEGVQNEFGKRGTGALRVERLPSSVSKLRVEEGELALVAPLSSKAFDNFGIAAGSGTPGRFANGDFSAMTNSYKTSGSVEVLYSSATRGEKLDWVAYNNEDWGYTPQVMFVNYDLFDGGGHGKWPCGGVEPPKSRYFLSIKGDATAESTFTITEKGRYALKFFAQGRYDQNSQHHSPIRVMIGPDAAHLETLGVVVATKEDKWLNYAYPTGLLTPGTYMIRLATETTGKDNCTSFADFALEQMAEVDADVVYRIPNGDFESRDLPLTQTTFTTNLALRGWTFDQGAFYNTYTNASHPGVGAYFNDVVLHITAAARTSMYGNNRCRLAICENKGCVAQTTFTPPAGTYRLRGDVRSYNGYWCTSTPKTLEFRNYPSIEARVIIGDATKVLGTMTTKIQVDTSFVWENSFTVDGTQAVTLQLESKASGGAAMIDNLVLVADSGTAEYVADGSFSSYPSGWQWISHTDSAVPGLSYSKAERMNMESQFNIDNWSTDASCNSWCARICQRGELRQSIAFEKAGLYRLRFRAHSRPNGPNGGYLSGLNPIEAYLTKDGVRSEIGWQHVGNTNFMDHVMDFRVPAAGTYDLSLQGMCDGTAGRCWPSGNDHSTLLDDVSVTRIEDNVANTADIPEDLIVTVSEKARLRLDFTGTNVVKRLVLGGRRVTGVVTAETHPDFVMGPGALSVPKHGFYLICR